MPNFPLIADCRIQLAIHENGEPLVDLKSIPSIHISQRYNNNNPDCSKLRRTVAEKLVQAVESLPKGMHFILIEGYRPLSIQTAIYNNYYQKLAVQNPQWTAAEVKEAATYYVAPPDSVPPHSTGGAFDISLINDLGQPLAMGSDTEDKPHENEYRNYTMADNITAQAKANRLILIDTLNQAGFVNYPAEWWHWSYGDRYWAYHTGHSHALYNTVVT